MANPMVIQTIQSAGQQLHIVQITYTDRKGVTTIRDTEPYEIKDNFYWGYSLMTDVERAPGIRKFNLDNISDALDTGVAYTPRWDVQF